ncbi:MAG: ATP-binding cassette domain-containing protein, partial [Caldimonas sp.]
MAIGRATALATMVWQHRVSAGGSSASRASIDGPKGKTNLTADVKIEPAVDVRQLTRRFGSLTAVDNVTLQVRRGQIFGLLGSNGAGKTTLIKMLTTLLPPTAGDAFVAGVSILSAPAEVRRRIGYVPQMLSADQALTGRENLLITHPQVADAAVFGVPNEDLGE